MPTTPTQPLQTYWQQQIQQWRQSETSGAHFCREHDISYTRFCYWRRKLGEDNNSPAKERSLSRFTRVVPHDRNMPAQVERSGLTLTLPNGVIIRGVTADHVELIGQLVRQL